MSQQNDTCLGSGKFAVVTSRTSVDLWSTEEVYKWLIGSGFEKYAESLAFQHKIDGQALLLLTESDLRQPPVCIQVLGDVKKLGNAIEQLKMCQRSLADSYQNRSDMFAAPVQQSAVPSQGLSISGSPPHPLSLPTCRSRQGENLIDKVESPDTRMKSIIKLFIAAMYCVFSLLLTAFVMVIVHDRVPDMKTYPPLPDLILDNLPLIPWAFQLCELLACVLACIWFIVLFFHKHRIVVMRRMFSLTGTVFLLRCVTMLITSLSVPGIHSECVGRGNKNIFEKFRDARNIWSGMGMSLNGVRTCGDYMFSGHTTAVTLLNHFITEYTPEDWYFLHTATWVMSLFGIFFILAAHEHYSIDVFVAFYISSRLFLYYHSMADHAPSAPRNDRRTRIWFPLLWFFESGSMGGRIPNEYGWPFPSLAELKEECVQSWLDVLDKISLFSYTEEVKGDAKILNITAGKSGHNQKHKHGRRKASKTE